MNSTSTSGQYPAAFYKVLRLKWKHDGHDDSRLSDHDIDGLVASSGHQPEPAQFVAGTLGDGSIIRWLIAHKELIAAIFQLGKLILPLLL